MAKSTQIIIEHTQEKKAPALRVADLIHGTPFSVCSPDTEGDLYLLINHATNVYVTNGELNDRNKTLCVDLPSGRLCYIDRDTKVFVRPARLIVEPA